jgi:hypothetical protein
MAFATIGTTGIADDAVTSAKVAPGVVDTEAQPNQEPLAYNGNMEVAQRGTSTTGLTNGSSGYHTVDRWKWHENGSPSSVWTMTQETLTSGNAYADGFNNALKIDCTTAQGSLGAGDTLHIEQRFEKQDLGAFKKGTANAQKFTFGFWVKATKTGTNIIELQDQGNDRAVSATYTISTTDTWEHKVVSFPADTTGNFGTGSDLGLIVRFYIYAGANYTSGSLQTAWGSSDTTKRANGQVNNADSTSNNWYITGVQLEVGEFTSSTIPPFKHESFGENLARCQRYYYKFAAADGGYFGSGNIDGNNDAQIFVPFSVTMRTSPSAIETNGTASHYAIRTTFNTTCDVVPVFSNTDLDRALVIFKKTNHGITNGSAALGRSQNNTAYLAWSAEL